MTIQTKSSESGSNASEIRQSLLEMARQLDRFGREAEEFLCGQYELLDRCITEFEQEKAAWRRQLRRETIQLAQQREELEVFRSQRPNESPSNPPDPAARRQAEAEEAARRSGDAPLRLLLQPRSATPMQVSVLFFEISKLNRDMGGRGVHFEVSEVRIPRKKLLTLSADPDSDFEIYEFHGFPAVPLKARGRHVTLESDLSDRLLQWINFKARLFQTSLVKGDLAAICRKSIPVRRSAEIRSFILEATRPLSPDQSLESESSRFSFGRTPAQTLPEFIRQQTLRLESCVDRFAHDTGLKVQIEI